MDVYIVKGYVYPDCYSEKIELFEGMEDKPKSYVGLGKRIDKSKIGQMEGGMIIGSYQIALIDKEQISEARKRIKGIIVSRTITELEKIKKTLEILNTHSLETEVIIKNINLA